MPHSSAFERYRAEASHALSRVKHYREQGDAARADQWHRTWSTAETAADAELRENGGGARVLRLRNPPPLRPLPEGLAALVLPPACTTAPPPEAPAAAPPAPADALSADPLPAALERHERIDRALRAGGPNPLPGELTEDEWQYHLTAFQIGGPYDCELLQRAEEAVEVIVEFRPEYWEPAPDGEPTETSAADERFESVTLPEALRIYRESLPELTEEELRADLETCLAAGRPDTAALLDEELARRERETAPEPIPGVGLGAPPASVGEEAASGVATVSERSDNPCRSDPPLPSRGPGGPRRRAPVYHVTPAAPSQSGTRKQPAPPADEPETSPAPDGYTTAPAWVDTAGRTRTWSLFNPAGEKMAEIVTKRDAEKLAALFNGLRGGERLQTFEALAVRRPDAGSEG